MVIRQITYEKTSNYRDEWELFAGGFGPQARAKDINDFWKFLIYFSINNLWEIQKLYHRTIHEIRSVCIQYGLGNQCLC
jgi:hypothetical protein